MAEKYHMLPSEVADRATTFDYIIQDAVRSYDEFHQKSKEGGNLNDLVKTENLQEIMERARGT